MTNSILSQGEIDALLHGNNDQSPSEQLLTSLGVVARKLGTWINGVASKPIEMDGPYVERLEKDLDQNMASQAFAVAADVAQHDVLLLMSVADAQLLAREFPTTPIQTMQMISQAWVAEVGELVGASYKVFQAQEVNLTSFSLPREEGKAYLVRHQLKQVNQEIEFCIVIRDLDKLESVFSKVSRVSQQSSVPIDRTTRFLKGIKSPVTEAVFTPIGDVLQAEDKQGMNLLADIDLNVIVELGKTSLTLDEILDLKKQSVIRLDRHAGEPVDVYVNNNYVAKGEVVVLEENFGVRILEIVPKSQRVGE